MIKWLDMIKHQVEESTYTGYKRQIEGRTKEYFTKHPIMLADLKPVHILDFYNWLYSQGLKGNTVVKYHANIRKAELEQEFQDKEFDIEYKYKNKIKSLEKENNHLLKIIDRFYETVEKFIHWICHKFGIGESKELINNFQEETHTFIDPVKQIENEEREKKWDLEL